MIDPAESPTSTKSIPHRRLQSLSSQTNFPLAKERNMAALERDPITCHVLDTTTGRPGAAIHVSLSPLSNPSIIFHSTTNIDGRVTNWSTSTSSQSSVSDQIKGLILSLAENKGDSVVPRGASLWKLRFSTGEYYGVEKTFFPVVELTFLVREGEHFHVPLLLGPYSFTTYRGS